MKKILVVDDEEDVLIILKTYLTNSGYDVTVSLSCDEGLDIFYSFRPHLVILDVNVGTFDGRAMCRNIKSKAEYQHIPVILISANRDNLNSYGDHGANAALEKPFNFSHLLKLLEANIK